MHSLRDIMRGPMTPGRLEWIGLRPGHRQRLISVTEAEIVSGRGLAGDHYPGRGDGGRAITLMQAEHLPALAAMLEASAIDPFQLRRNLVVAGINLLALKDRTFTIGQARLAMTGPCAPCFRMDENLGPGGFQAMRGHGGITARVLRGGRIRTGDAVIVEPYEEPAQPQIGLAF